MCFDHVRLFSSFHSTDLDISIPEMLIYGMVGNHCVIDVFCGVFVLSHDFHFLMVRGLLSYDWVRYLPFFLRLSLIELNRESTKEYSM